MKILDLRLASLLMLLVVPACEPAGDDDSATPDEGSAPSAAVVSIEPSEPAIGESLHAVIVEPSVDPDGDQVSYRYRWSRDGEEQLLWIGAQVSEGITRLHEEWTVVVEPTDGEHVGEAATDTVTIVPPPSDDDDDVEEGPIAAQYEMELTVSGQDQAAINLDIYLYGDEYLQECMVSLVIQGTVSYGLAQGDDYWTFLDTVIHWTSAIVDFDNCPEQWQIFETPPLKTLEWHTHPMAFVSCDQIAANPALASWWVAEDPYYGGPGTFGYYCYWMDPWANAKFIGYPVEGIWMLPVDSAVLGEWAAYFPAPEQTNTNYWMFIGVLMSGPGNWNEPMPGMEGVYVGSSLYVTPF